MRLWLASHWKLLVVGVVVGVLAVGGVVFLRRKPTGTVSGTTDVTIPTIVNGELVLPKLATESAASNALGGKAKLGIISANLIGITDSQTQQLSAIRVLGEMTNAGEKIIDGVSPVVRFIDKNGKVVGQKIGKLSPGWDFFGVFPGEKTMYDVTVDNPLAADKLEIVLNVSSATNSAVFDVLKVASRSMEVKTAAYRGDASSAGGEKVEYYSVSGRVVNALDSSVSDISIYSWVRDKEGKVFSFGRQDFKNDLLASGDKLDFKILLLPLKTGESYDSYEVAAWGKRYKLNL